MNNDQQKQAEPKITGTSLDDIMKRKDPPSEEQREAIRDFIIGGVSFLIGFSIMALAFTQMITKDTGTYFFMWGPVVFGGERCFQGWRKLKTGR